MAFAHLRREILLSHFTPFYHLLIYLSRRQGLIFDCRLITYIKVKDRNAISDAGCRGLE